MSSPSPDSVIATSRVARVISHLCAHPTAAAAATPTSSAPPDFVRSSTRGRVGLIVLSRPQALNALNDQLMREVAMDIQRYQASGEIGCIVITGEGDKAFAAGVRTQKETPESTRRGVNCADIKEMVNKSFYDMVTHDKIAPWEVISKCAIPIIAAVNGYALGGGCEIAMMCDIIIASENAKFGQPEIVIGTIPGAGGTQRLTKAIGKSRAMEMVLTGGTVSAHELAAAGLVSHVYPSSELLPAALKLADRIASMSLPTIKLAKQAVLASFESTLATGMAIERSLFQSTFALQDQKVGMQAFVAKKKPEWKHK